MTKDSALEGPVEAPQRPAPRWATPFLGVGGAIVGGLYVIFMPFILGGMVLYYAGVGVGRLVKAGTRKLAPRAKAASRLSDRPPQ